MKRSRHDQSDETENPTEENLKTDKTEHELVGEIEMILAELPNVTMSRSQSEEIDLDKPHFFVRSKLRGIFGYFAKNIHQLIPKNEPNLSNLRSALEMYETKSYDTYKVYMYCPTWKSYRDEFVDSLSGIEGVWDSTSPFCELLGSLYDAAIDNAVFYESVQTMRQRLMEYSSKLGVLVCRMDKYSQ